MSESKKVWLDGKLVNAADAKVSVFDHGVLYGDGVFEGIRIYSGRVLKMRTHLLRLYAGARTICLEIPYPLEQLEAAIRQTCQANGLSDGYIRLCVTRGPGTLGLNPFDCKQACVFIIADTISLYPAEMYEKGMHIITATTLRNHPAALNPRLKSLNYLNNILARIEAHHAGVPEALMLNTQGFVAECTGDNIFIVKQPPGQTPRLFTPPLHAGILEGVTRNMVIELAYQEGLSVHQVDLTRHDIYTADEMFLTGTAAEVIAVTAVDQRKIGTGLPGPLTNTLIESFKQVIANAPED